MLRSALAKGLASAPQGRTLVNIHQARYQFSMHGAAYYYTDSANIECIVTAGEARHYPWHMHTRHWTVGVVLSGSVEVTTGADTQHFCGGQYFFIRLYEPHSLRVALGSSLFVFCFDNLEAFSAYKDLLPALTRHVPLFRDQEKLLAGTFARVCMEKVVPRIAACNDSFTPSASLVSRAIQAVILQMLNDPGRFSGVEHAAAYAGYSPWHFLRSFQKITGMTPHAFQLLCRLRLLRGLLRADTASAVAAVSAGFSDQSHMHKVFKRHHGMTPGQFKQASFRLAL